MISYRHELSQTGTARGGRHSLVVSSALARELERDIEDHRRRVYLERSGTTAPKRVWHPALYKTQDVVNIVCDSVTVFKATISKALKLHYANLVADIKLENCGKIHDPR